MISDIYWIESDVLGPGRLAVSARPRGGDWLSDEVRAWHQAGVNDVVSLLTSAEARELDIEAERAACENAGISFVAVPVEDRGLPSSALRFRAAAAAEYEKVSAGAAVSWCTAARASAEPR